MINAILNVIGIGAIYLIALALIVAGVYIGFVLIANPIAARFSKLLRYVGVVLIAIGAGLAIYNVGKTNGASGVEAEWRAKNYEAKIARLEQEAAAKKLAADLAGRQAAALADQKDDLQKKVNDYAEAIRNAASCRRSTRDDDRRMCAIIGRSAAGCIDP